MRTKVDISVFFIIFLDHVGFNSDFIKAIHDETFIIFALCILFTFIID